MSKEHQLRLVVASTDDDQVLTFYRWRAETSRAGGVRRQR